ncbi:hypothetical protein MNBD_PLANCTO02-1292 [hydrothermal vent metagenome]|uniref:TIGR03790 family protein n=1 Tax=hydrothermal vent metagenome TaxID=652676 RepID=A0A3B1DEK7_9ZZZZ
MKAFRLLLIVTFFLSLFSISKAGGGPENVLVVVNADSWASKTIANEYVRLRNIPPSNVLYLEGISTYETISVDDFRKKILIPTLTYLKKNKLSEQIDCIAYSSDIPYSVNLHSDVAKLSRKLGNTYTPVGAINGMTYLAGLVLAENANYLGRNTNFYSRRMVRVGGPAPKKVKRPSNKEFEQFTKSNKLTKNKKWKEAAAILEPLAKAHPQFAIFHYNLACSYARLNQVEKMMDSLESAYKAGWTNSQHSLKDEDLKPFVKKKKFLTWIAKVKKKEAKLKKFKYKVQPSQAFRHTYQWNRQGKRVTKNGSRYLLSTMLAMTSGRGNSVEEAITSLRRSKQADETHPKGTIYILKNNNVRSRTRERAFEPTVATLKKMGINAEIINGILPKNKKDVMGVVIGSARYPWEGSGSTILPGAIVESLTSTSGVMRERASQTPLSNMIRNGAAASSGTVTEPYALQAKFPLPFIHVHYAKGCSLAEAYYQSLTGPYQLLIVGDPLCQPWASKPKIAVKEIYPGIKLRKSIQLTPLYKGKETDIDRFELYVDGLRVSKAASGKQQLTLNAKKLSVGFHEIRIVAVKSGEIETQGNLIIPIEVIGKNKVPLLTVTPGEKVQWNQSITVKSNCKGAKEILLFHNSRQLGRKKGNQVTFKINPQVLGQGFVTLFVKATVNGKQLQSVPVTIEIVSPRALRAVKMKRKTKLVKGLQLRWKKNRKGVVIKDTRKADWLAKQKLPAKTKFELTGIFEAEEDAVYQFQLNDNCKSRIFIDNVELKPTNKTGWKYLPVHLAKGTHYFGLKGTTSKRPRLRVCFGGKGTYSISEKQFSH